MPGRRYKPQALAAAGCSSPPPGRRQPRRAADASGSKWRTGRGNTRWPCTTWYRKRISCAASSAQWMPRSPVANTSRSLSPTRSTMAWKSSSAAMPCWMPLITRQLGGALLGIGLRAARFGRALGHLRFQPGRKAQVGQRHRRLAGEHGEQVAVGVVEAAEGAFDVGVEIAEQLAAAPPAARPGRSAGLARPAPSGPWRRRGSRVRGALRPARA